MTAPTQPTTVAYLVNCYPAPSHSFIRREVQALERRGVVVHRYSIRPGLVPPSIAVDRDELRRTVVILRPGLLARSGLLWAVVRQWLRRPRRTWATVRQALRLARGADRGWLRHLAYFVEACWLAGHLDPRVGWLHAHHGTNSAAVAMLAARLRALPFSFTAHGPEEFERAAGIQLAAKIAAAAQVVAISDHGLARLQELAGPAASARLRVVRCGLDAAFLQVPPAPMPASPDLLFVGRLMAWKGVTELLQACGLLHARGVRFHLRILGDGPEAAAARTAIAAAGLQSAITMLGFGDEAVVREWLDRSRGLLLPSHAEGLPVVLMEAMARGRPVVTTPVAGIPELVQPGRHGWLVPPGDVPALAAAMTALLELPPAAWAEMGNAGREAVLARHRIEDAAEQLHAVFQGAATGSSPAARWPGA